MTDIEKMNNEELVDELDTVASHRGQAMQSNEGNEWRKLCTISDKLANEILRRLNKEGK